MPNLLIKNATIINRGHRTQKDVLIKGDRIERIDQDISAAEHNVLDASDYFLLPGIIDDQVHFREPGFMHKASILSESRAAVAGGVTSFMEMPNTKPQTLTQELLEEKYQRAAGRVPANYSFYMGASNENLDEVLRTDPKSVCGIKVFMGSSTGGMLVDDESILRNIFGKAELLIATHCESEEVIRASIEKYKALYGPDATAAIHPIVRSRESCYASSSLAVSLAQELNTRLHILHLTTAEELDLFRNDIPLREKKITSEACVHHLFFDESHYEELGNRIKCNPAIKATTDRAAVRQALLDDRIDVIATDHAPHTWEEKSQSYWDAPAGLPLVQHGIDMMMELVRESVMDMELLVHKMCHAPAECFEIKDRGYVEEGMKADLVLYDPNVKKTVRKSNILYHCKWSPLEGREFQGGVRYTFVNGQLVYDNGLVRDVPAGERLTFDRG